MGRTVFSYNYSLFDFKYIERYGNKMIKEAIEKIVDKRKELLDYWNI